MSETNPGMIPWPDLSDYGLRALYYKTPSEGRPVVILAAADPEESAEITRARLSQYRGNLRSVLTREAGQEVFGKPLNNGARFLLAGPGIERVNALYQSLSRGFANARLVWMAPEQVMFNRYQRQLAQKVSSRTPHMGQENPQPAQPEGNQDQEQGQLEQETVATPSVGEDSTAEQRNPLSGGESGNVQHEYEVNDNGFAATLTGAAPLSYVEQKLADSKVVFFEDVEHLHAIVKRGQRKDGEHFYAQVRDNTGAVRTVGGDPRDPLMSLSEAAYQAALSITDLRNQRLAADNNASVAPHIRTPDSTDKMDPEESSDSQKEQIHDDIPNLSREGSRGRGNVEPGVDGRRESPGERGNGPGYGGLANGGEPRTDGAGGGSEVSESAGDESGSDAGTVRTGSGDHRAAAAVDSQELSGLPDGTVRAGLSGGSDRRSSENRDEVGERSGGSDKTDDDAAATEAGGDSGRVRPAGGADSGTERTDDSAVAQGSDGSSATGERLPDADAGTGHESDARAAEPAGTPAPLNNGFRFAAGHDFGGKKVAARVEDNLAAMECLFEIEAENRPPTDDEKSLLAEYSGWGGIHPQFLSFIPSTKPSYLTACEDRLQSWARNADIEFSQNDLNSIRSTILNAHYTHEGVIRPIWGALQRMGIKADRTIEPSCGTLNFISHAPVQGAAPRHVTGVEIDPVTSRIASKIHPEATVLNQGLEDADLSNDFFDLSISNVPFGDYKVFDKNRPEWKDSIHNYFIKKKLDLVRPGGISAFVVSRYFMDSKDDAIRKYVMDNAHVVNVVRLPSGTFRENTQTDVTTDIVIVQKKGDFTPNYTPLDIQGTIKAPYPVAATRTISDGEGNEYEPGELMAFRVNQLFSEEPERYLGNPQIVSSQYSFDLAVEGDTDIEGMVTALKDRLERLTPEAITQPRRHQSASVSDLKKQFERTVLRSENADAQPGEVVFNEDTQTFHHVEKAGGEKVLSEQPIKVAKKYVKPMKAMLGLMATTQKLLETEAQGNDAQTEKVAADLRETLNSQYDDFSRQFGSLNTKVHRKLFRHDVREPFLYALEHENADTGEISKTAIFEKRTVSPTVQIPDSAESLTDALALSLTYTGKIAPDYMKDLLGDAFDSAESVVNALIEQELAFLNPGTGEPETVDTYLSGNLRPKIDKAKQAAAADPEFERNVKALEESLPEPLLPSQIQVGVDAFWIPKEILEDFMKSVLDFNTSGDHGVTPVFDRESRHWRVQQRNLNKPLAGLARNQEQVTMHRWGTSRCDAFRLLNHAFTNTQPVVRDKISFDPDEYVVNQEETLKAQGKLEEIEEAFKQWVMREPSRAKRLTDTYNERFNTFRLTEPDGSHMVYPGMADSWVPRVHQNNFVWRAVSGRNTMTAHCVGAGKTFQLVSTAIRGKQMGRWNKPMCVVPNHMLRQFAGDAQSIFPSARILVLDKEDITPAKRANFVARAAAGDWDLIVCTHSSFSRIGVPGEFEAKMLADEKDRLSKALAQEQNDNKSAKKPPSQKNIEKKLKNLEAQLKRKNAELEKRQKDNILNLQEMGVDHMGIDEAHYYKNLAPDTAKSIPGVSTTESVRAWDMFMKCRYMEDLHGSPNGVLMATGTPISNSLIECYTFTRMLRPDLLKEMDIENFNDWMSLFAETVTSLEIKPEGGGYQNKTRLSQFKNVPELVKLFRQFVDVKTREDLNLPSPNVTHETIVAPTTDLMAAFMKYIEGRARHVRSHDDEPSSDAEALAVFVREHLYGRNDKRLIDEAGNVDRPEEIPEDILLTIATDGRKASLDPRLLHPQLPDDPASKVNLMIGKAFELYQNYEAEKACQLIFCDFSSPTGSGLFNLYDDIRQKLIDRGVDESEIAYIHDAKTDEEKEKLFERAREGQIRFLLGSTDKMGVGTNVQKRLVAMHQMDPPWKPSDIEQRLGRMDRQGNLFDEVFNFTYTTQDSFDLFIWETLKRKQKMISTAMSHPDKCERTIEDDSAIQFEDVLQVTTGNDKIKTFMETRSALDKLRRFRNNHQDEQADLGNRIEELKSLIQRMEYNKKDMEEEYKLVHENAPLHFEIEGAQPGLQEGSASHIGGIKAIKNVLEKQYALTRAYSKRDVGVFGGLKVTLNHLRAESPKVEIMRLNGRMDEVAYVALDQKSLELAEDENRMDPWEKAARALNRELQRIAGGTELERQEMLIASKKEDLAAAESDFGSDFPRQQELDELEEKYSDLLAEVGSELDADKVMDPEPIIDFIRQINQYTNTPIEPTDLPVPINSPIYAPSETEDVQMNLGTA
ncbi:helicase [Marinobacter halodurans]|uniref:Helicase n=1 Tax=Marinobacter halodurans TaxID=2528979 RepID=A0ABY1ZPB5_9GAMM|nr:helicase-related protein [Marinobacter halodurans]TBW57435.1 helicase [Marinobacter halodurans]